MLIPMSGDGLTENVVNIIIRASAAAFTAAAIVYGLTPVVRRIALQRGTVTRPSTDRWGRRVVPRLGGMALFVGFVVATIVWVPITREGIGLLAGAALIFGLGFWDDIRRLPPYTKLVLQLVVGCVIVMSGVRIEIVPWLWLAVPLSLLWFTLVINAFNLLDNMDGLAAGIGAIAAGLCVVQSYLSHQDGMMIQSAIVAGICVGFLRYNFPPAKIFMGDSGSHLLGLALAVLALMGSWQRSTQLLSVLVIPLLVLAVPIVDTCFVTIQRLLHQRHPFTGGTDHLSHRLVILGLNQRQTVLVLYTVGAVFGIVGLLSGRLGLLQALVAWLFALTAVVLGGIFLSKVAVYEVRREPGDRPDALRRPATFIETMLLHKRRVLEVLIDFLLICGSYVAAHLLRFEGALDVRVQQVAVHALPVVIIVNLLCFMGFGLYRGVWKYAGLYDVMAIFKAVTLGSLCSATVLLYLWRFQGFSRAVFIIDWLLLFLAVSAARMTERLLSAWITGSLEKAGAPVLIVGAGDTAELVLRQLKINGHAAKKRVMGFLDDDPAKQGNRIHGLPVLGTRYALQGALEAFQIHEVLIAVPQPSPELLRHVEQACDTRGVQWRLVSAALPNT